MKKLGIAWGGLGIGCLLAISAIYGIINIDDGFMWRGVYVPIWSTGLLLPVGIVMAVVFLRAILRGEGKPKPYTDEDAPRPKPNWTLSTGTSTESRLRSRGKAHESESAPKARHSIFRLC